MHSKWIAGMDRALFIYAAQCKAQSKGLRHEWEHLLVAFLPGDMAAAHNLPILQGKKNELLWKQVL